MVSDERIEPALHAMLANDGSGLNAALAADPELIDEPWNDCTLLEWCTQPPHGIEPDVIDVLIARGAELDRALNLAGCFDLAEMCRQLLDAGADPTARADAGITPLESAAMHGSTRSADVLSEHGIHRPSLWLAAAAGHLDLVREWVGDGGELLAPPGQHRPDWSSVGRPEGAAPTNDPAEILGEALVFAAANGRVEVVDHLIGCGVDIDSRPYNNTTGLHLAIQFEKLDMVAHLVALGARIDIEDDQHHSGALGWAVACDDGEGDSARIRALVEGAAGVGGHGAQPSESDDSDTM